MTLMVILMTKSKGHLINDKRPRPHGLAPREHYVRKGGSWKAKMSFPSRASADNWINIHSTPRLTWVCYECQICHQWHLSSIRKDEDE